MEGARLEGQGAQVNVGIAAGVPRGLCRGHVRRLERPAAGPRAVARGRLSPVLGEPVHGQPGLAGSKRHHGLADLRHLAPHTWRRRLGLQRQPGRADHLRAAVLPRLAGGRDRRSSRPARGAAVLLRRRDRHRGGAELGGLHRTGHRAPAAGFGPGVRRLARLLLAGDDGPGADDGASPATPAGDRLELPGLAERLDRRPGPGRDPGGHLSRRRLRHHPGALYRRRPGPADDPPADPAHGAARFAAGPGQGGPGLCLGEQGGVRRHLPRPGGGDPGRGHRPAAGLRQGRAARRRPGFRHPSRRPRAGGDPGGAPTSRSIRSIARPA